MKYYAPEYFPDPPNENALVATNKFNYRHMQDKIPSNNLKASFLFDHNSNQTIIKIPGDITQMSKINLSLLDETKIFDKGLKSSIPLEASFEIKLMDFNTIRDY